MRPIFMYHLQLLFAATVEHRSPPTWRRCAGVSTPISSTTSTHTRGRAHDGASKASKGSCRARQLGFPAQRLLASPVQLARPSASYWPGGGRRRAAARREVVDPSPVMPWPPVRSMEIDVGDQMARRRARTGAITRRCHIPRSAGDQPGMRPPIWLLDAARAPVAGDGPPPGPGSQWHALLTTARPSAGWPCRRICTCPRAPIRPSRCSNCARLDHRRALRRCCSRPGCRCRRARRARAHAPPHRRHTTHGRRRCRLVDVRSGDEIGRLAADFNRLAESLEANSRRCAAS